MKIENSSLQQKRWSDRLARHGKIWLNRKSLSNRIVSVLLILGAICGLLTYASLVNVPPFGRSSSGLIVMLNIDLVILLILLVLVSRRLIALYNKRKKGIVGSNLHVRLVSIFSLIAAVPAILMAVFSVGFFYFGLHGWLDDRVRTAIEESEAVADAYLNEHRQLIRADIMAMASDLNRQSDLLMDNPEAMEKMVKTQSFLRNFSDVYLFNSVGSIQAKSNPESQFNFLSIDFNDLENAKNNEIVLIGDTQNSIRAFLRLNQYSDLFVLADRAVDTKVLNHVEKTRQGVAQYEDLQKRSARLQILLTSIYILVTLLLTIAAVWFGLSFARRLMNPITALINASESVGKGDLTIRVDTQNAMDEFKMLGRAFNTMTEQIETQQQELIAANTQMDFRRRFTETILGGVSTGILSVDFEGRITLANNASGALLFEEIENLLGQKISYIMPELSPHLDSAFEIDSFGTVKNCEISVRRGDDSIRTFMARIVVEQMDQNQKGAIITFDDLTTVLSTQRKAAWADIARRIAHEIKNPLTPIQLSAERLNRKYRKTLADEDKEIFDQCTETIIRHVGDIKTMVNAFSDFAKMPDPVMKKGTILPLVRDIFALNKNAHNDIGFELIINTEMDDMISISHDEQQIRQVLTNLIKNAIESVEIKTSEKMIQVFCLHDKTNHAIVIGVCDNGDGLPTKDLNKLTEPYVTHKKKGTGLGLAIVKKIVEDHEGELLFSAPLSIIKDDNNDYKELSGASVFFTLPIQDNLTA